jgi:hypothetical protein
MGTAGDRHRSPLRGCRNPACRTDRYLRHRINLAPNPTWDRRTPKEEALFRICDKGSAMRFLCGEMLRRLGKWLRAAG